MLRIQPEISSKDLAYLLGIRQQSLNELLNKLEKKGYVTRVPSETDRRVMLVRLTEQGKQAQDQNSETDDAGIFDCLSPGEQDQFNAYLDRMIAAFEEKCGDSMNDGTREWMRGACERMGKEPVSYTHLDVYKRQALMCALLLLVPVFAGCSQSGDSSEAKSITVVDDTGREVTIPQPLEKVVVANRYNSELIRGIGAIDKVVAVDKNTAQDRVYWLSLIHI